MKRFSDSDAFKRLRAIWRDDAWIKPFFVRYRKVLILTLALGLAAFLFAGALMFTSGYMISLAATLPFTVLALHVPSLFVRIFGLGKPALQYLERLASHDWVLRMTSELRRRLYETVEGMTSAVRGRTSIGDALGLLTEDIGHVQDLYLRTVLPMASAWLLYVVVIVALGLFSVPVACALGLLLAVVLFVAPLASVCVNGARIVRAKTVRAALYDDLVDNVLGVADWVHAGRSDDYVGRFEQLETRVHDVDAEVRRYNRLRDVFLQVAFGLCAVLLLAWAALAFGSGQGGAGLVGALGGVGSQNAPAYAANWVAAFVLCFFPLIEAFSPVPTAALGLVTHGASIERLNDFGAPGALSQGRASDVSAEAIERARESCDVSLERVSFSYDEGGAPVISDLSLNVPSGQHLAVLGRSGAGKSTLAALVRGERAPYAGSVLVGGVEASAWGDSISRLVGVIHQRPHLFNQTLRDNLLIGRLDATDAELKEVLAKVGLADLLDRLPDGLDTMVDESGRRFSGGERHRIALARILLAQVPVVVLDEPFCGLDPATEQGLIDSILSTLEDSTIIMITHHLQGVARMDRAVFLEEGSVVMDGSPADLARDDPRYARLLAFDEGAW